MELKNLSSNWKKLQQQYQTESDSKPPKRKASSDISPALSNPKRQKANPKPQPTASKSSTTNSKSKPMGAVASHLSAPFLALWARENDISSSSLTAAYSAPPSTHPVPAINIGLTPSISPGKYVALDCEMVGVGPPPHNDSVLARVSLVDFNGSQLYDSFVIPKEPVTDYRTHVSGITPFLLRSARPLEEVQRDVAALIQGRVLVGHAIRHDLDALMLGHPRRDIRDTSRYPGFRVYAAGRTPGLKKLAREVLGIEIQSGEHSSVEDARATMSLFRKEKEGFEREHKKKWGVDRRDKEEGDAEGPGKTRNVRKARKAKKGKKGKR